MEINQLKPYSFVRLFETSAPLSLAVDPASVRPTFPGPGGRGPRPAPQYAPLNFLPIPTAPGVKRETAQNICFLGAEGNEGLLSVR